MSWDSFHFFAITSILLSTAGAVLSLVSPGRGKPIRTLALAGIAVMAAFIAGLWISLGRPPLKTMGETRLWYSFFVLVTGYAVYSRWKFRWILLLTTVLAAVFSIINMARPEIHDQTLVPALQSFWFIPHVTIYMVAYGILACSFILALAGLIRNDMQYLESTDILVYIGTAMLFLGLTTGAIWAKQAWGNFWEWDPKETWAAVTCSGYLLYIHLRLSGKKNARTLYWILIISFLLLQMCWYGYQYIPASENSMHMYNISK